MNTICCLSEGYVCPSFAVHCVLFPTFLFLKTKKPPKPTKKHRNFWPKKTTKKRVYGLTNPFDSTLLLPKRISKKANCTNILPNPTKRSNFTAKVSHCALTCRYWWGRTKNSSNTICKRANTAKRATIWSVICLC